MCSISVCPKNGIAACCLGFVGDPGGVSIPGPWTIRACGVVVGAWGVTTRSLEREALPHGLQSVGRYHTQSLGREWLPTVVVAWRATTWSLGRWGRLQCR